MKYKVLSLFSGLAGLDLGFSERVIVHRDSVDEEFVESDAPTKDFVYLKQMPFTTVFQNDILKSAKEIAEFDHRRKMQDNEDKKEDQIRSMAWFALWGMLLYPVTIIATSLAGQENAAQLISDIAPTYFVAIAGLVAAFFGAQAYSKGKNGNGNGDTKGTY